MTDNYITIAEFAKLAGVSRQAIYSRLDNQVDNKLNEFVKLDNSGKKPKKLINTKALELFSNSPSCKADNQLDSQIDSKVDKEHDILQEQLQEKDKTISSLLNQLEQLQEQNEKLNSSLIDQGKELTRLLDQQQQLQAIYAKQLMPPEVPDIPDVNESKKHKTGLFRRFFK